MSKSKALMIIAIVILIALASIGCDGINDDVETVQEAAETVGEIGTVHGMLKDLADQDYAQPNTR